MTAEYSFIQINRLIVYSGSFKAYDQEFHAGVNIIHSNGNSAGKSTILDFIFFLLGGDLSEWITEVERCDYVVGEFNINNRIVTLKRELHDSKYPPLYIYEGAFEEVSKEDGAWLKYLNKRSNVRESYSQALFRLLDYPEAQLQKYSNITIHELLRLIYSDQMTAVNHVFMHQDFDPEEMRQTIGEFLLGVDDLELHGIRLELRASEKSLDNLKGRIASVTDMLSSADYMETYEEFQAELKSKILERDALRSSIGEMELMASKARQVDEPVGMADLRSLLLEIKKQIRIAKNECDSLAFDIEDSELFIESIIKKQDALGESEHTRDLLGQLDFMFCPSCLTPIHEQPEDQRSCHLCKEAVDVENGGGGLLRIQFELNYQLNESTHLLDQKRGRYTKLKDDLKSLGDARKQYQERYNGYIIDADPLSAEIRDSFQGLGLIDGQINHMREKGTLLEKLHLLISKQDELKGNISSLKGKLAEKKLSRSTRKEQIKNTISDLTTHILRLDIPSEESFKDATEVDIEFGKNRIIVDGRIKFSASSIAYLKSAFYYALFLASLRDPNIRYPRFVLLDNLEDKGAVPDRIHNIHDLIIDGVRDITSPHQIIFTTSILHEKYIDSDLVVGPMYDFDHKTLDLNQ